MKTEPNVHPMERLKRKLGQILQAIPPGSDVVYVDYPVHGNGGDLLIMKGTEAFFKAHRIRIRARYSVFDFPEGLTIPPDCIIALHGGGNFGDLYPAHQKLREKVVAAYARHRVVMLPQTIFYRSVFELERTAAILNRHPDLHLYVRDTTSLELAQDKFATCGVYLSPDMAHQLWPIRSARAPDKELLLFLRADIEKAEEQDRLTSSGAGDRADWSSLFSGAERKSIRLFSGMLRSGSVGQPVGAAWSRFAGHLVRKAVHRFSRYRTVQTSRLHGHILSCLMDKPNVLIDNAYGKNAGYYRTWTEGVASSELLEKPANPASGGRASTLLTPQTQGGKAYSLRHL